MPDEIDATEAVLKARIVSILDENRVMSIATVRADGWPQVTMVGYAHDDLSLYFVVAADSQKRKNIERDRRVSIAIGQEGPNHIRGLSMAAHVSEVTDLDEVSRLNAIVSHRYPEQSVFAPRELSAAVMRATPIIVSVIDQSMGPGQAELFEITSETRVRRLSQKR